MKMQAITSCGAFWDAAIWMTSFWNRVDWTCLLPQVVRTFRVASASVWPWRAPCCGIRPCISSTRQRPTLMSTASARSWRVSSSFRWRKRWWRYRTVFLPLLGQTTSLFLSKGSWCSRAPMGNWRRKREPTRPFGANSAIWKLWPTRPSASVRLVPRQTLKRILLFLRPWPKRLRRCRPLLRLQRAR